MLDKRLCKCLNSCYKYRYTKDKDYRTHEIMPEKLGKGIVCSFFVLK